MRHFLLLTLLLGGATTVAASEKEVVLKWSPIPGAVAYQIEASRDGAVQLETKVAEAEWKGALPFGLNTYRIRAIDGLDRPGDWSAPRPIVVMPPPAELLLPKNQARISTYGPHSKILLKWKKAPGIEKYRVEIRDSQQKLIQEHTTLKSELEITGLPPGTYLWSAIHHIEAGPKYPRELQGKKWLSTSNNTQVFSTALAALEAPKPLFPKGTTPLPKNGKQVFRWTPVPGALHYNVLVFPKGSTKWERASSSKVPMVEIEMAHEGKYTWSVQAVAHEGRTPSSLQAKPGPISKLDFELDRNAMFIEGSGYLALSGMYAPFTYNLESPARNGRGGNGTPSQSIVSRIAGEYWWNTDWGVGASFDYAFMPLTGSVAEVGKTVSQKIFTRYEAEIVAKYRFPLANHRYGWFFAPKFGAAIRESPHISIVVPASGADAYFDSASFLGLGLTGGFDLRKQFSDRFSIGIRTGIYFPIVHLKGPSGSTLERGDILDNAHLGVQGLFWLNSRWGLGGGVYFERRLNRGAAGFVTDINGDAVNAAKAAEIDSLRMDATYFHGSLIYRFGD